MASNPASYADWENWHAKRTSYRSVSPELEQFFHELTEGHDCNKSLRIFLPLCGKTFDMLWLAEHGHEIVAVDFVKNQIECFFTENNLSFTTEDIEITPGGSMASLYRCTKEGINITILHCSIYSVTETALGGKFHAVWDRGSLVAIDPADRVRYVAVMKSLLFSGSRLLLDNLRYDQSKLDGPPFSVSEEELQALFQESFHIQELGMEELEVFENLYFELSRFVVSKGYWHLLTMK